MAYSPASLCGGGQLSMYPIGIASGPSQAEASRTARTKATSMHMSLYKSKWYGEHDALNIISLPTKQTRNRCINAWSGLGPVSVECLYGVLPRMNADSCGLHRTCRLAAAGKLPVRAGKQPKRCKSDESG